VAHSYLIKEHDVHQALEAALPDTVAALVAQAVLAANAGQAHITTCRQLLLIAARCVVIALSFSVCASLSEHYLIKAATALPYSHSV
jgi:hypothetical protein